MKPELKQKLEEIYLKAGAPAGNTNAAGRHARDPIEVTDLPAATSDDPVGFFEAIKHAGHEGKWLRLNAATQRRFFKRAPFGKQAVRVDETGKITTHKSVAFGQDADRQEYLYDHGRGKFILNSDGRDAEI